MIDKNILKHIGRIKIKSSFVPTGDVEKDKILLLKMLEETLTKHNDNQYDIKILKEYHDNKQTLDKHKEMRSDIDNQVKVPDVYRITRDLNGHICGSGVIFSDSTGKYPKQMLKLNTYFKKSFFSSVYIKANKNASLYGVGYYYIEPNKNEEILSPFSIESENLDPYCTYCVYSNDVIPKKTWAVLVNEYTDEKKNLKKRYLVWSKYNQFVVEEDGIKQLKVIEDYPLVFKQIPVIEIQRNEDRIGDCELALGIIDAKNLLFSNRIDDVQQVVDYVYILYNLRITDEDATLKDKKDALTNILNSRVIELETINPQIQPKVDILKNPLNQTEIQTLANYLDSILNVIVALPDRNSSGGGQNDTGVANDYKLGFRTLDTYSDIVTPYIIKSLEELLSIIFKIIKNDSEYSKEIGKLKLSDVEVKPQRNKIFSITDAANSYSTLRSAGLNDEDALKITNISQDVAETANKNKASREKEQAVATKTDKIVEDVSNTQK